MTYLPHRGVVRNLRQNYELYTMEELNVKISLNEILHKGPILNPNIFELLLKFRIYPNAITGDIEKAYLQIEVDEKHRDFLRFLWYSKGFTDNSDIVIHRFHRVMFGIIY